MRSSSLKQVDHINNEKRLMAQIDYPFCVNMLGYAKDDQYVYIVMECISGAAIYLTYVAVPLDQRRRNSINYVSWGPIFWPFLRRPARGPTIKALWGTIANRDMYDN